MKTTTLATQRLRAGWLALSLLLGLTFLMFSCTTPSEPENPDVPPPEIPENTGFNAGGPSSPGWAVPIGSEADGAVVKIDVDSDKNVHAIAAVDGSANFFVMSGLTSAVDNSTIQQSLPAPALETGIVYVQYAAGNGQVDESGTLVYATELASMQGSGDISGFALSPNGDILVAGNFTDEIRFRDGTSFNSEGVFDGFVARFNTNGALLWARQLSSPSGTLRLGELAVNEMGEGYISGFVQGSTTLGPYVPNGIGPAFPNPPALIVEGIPTITITAPSGSESGLFLSYDAEGNLRWARQIDALVGARGMSVAIANDGDPIICGDFSGDLSAGPQSWPEVPSSPPQTPFRVLQMANTTATALDIFVIRYSRDGIISWGRQFGGAGQDNAVSIDALSTGEIALAGYFIGDWTNAPALQQIGAQDIFLAILDEQGLPIYSNSFGSTANDQCFNLDANDQHIMIAGIASGEVAIAPNITDFNQTANVAPDAILAVYALNTETNAWENTQMILPRKSSGYEIGLAVGIEPTPDVFSASVGYSYRYAWGGSFRDTVVFETPLAGHDLDAISLGGLDGFVWSARTFYGDPNSVPERPIPLP